MSDCCFDSVKLFLLSVIQGCLSHVSVSPGGLGYQRQEQTGHTETRLLFWALGHDLCLSAMVSPFLSQREVTIWWFEGTDERTAVIWAGWPELDPYRPSRLIPTSSFLTPILGGQAGEVADDGVGVGAGFDFPLCQLVSVFTTDGGWWRGSVSFLACPGGRFPLPANVLYFQRK